MKLAKGVVFFFFMALLGSCFSPPEFPIKPEIGFKSIQFKKIGGISDPDSLILKITFKDGDGDLGLDADKLDDASFPYHLNDYFLEKDGELTRVGTEIRYTNIPPVVKVDPGQSGKLVTVRTRNDPRYSDLPEYVAPFSCSRYNFDSVYVSGEDKNIFDKSYNLIDSFIDPAFPPIYLLLDTMYYEPNPNHNNITVQFETKNSDGTYTIFDWPNEICGSEGYDGRFPLLAETGSKVPLDGVLQYSMVTTGFLIKFNGETLRLKVQIKDRALNLSNFIYTPDFKIE